MFGKSLSCICWEEQYANHVKLSHKHLDNLNNNYIIITIIVIIIIIIIITIIILLRVL